MSSLDDLFDTNDAEFEQAGYVYHQAVAAAKNAEVIDPLENLSDEELLAQWQKEAQKELTKRREEASFEAARTFLAEEPRYVSTPENTKRMVAQLETMIGKDTTPTPDDLHAAFDVLNRRRQLAVHDLPREPRPVLSDADLYEMPLDDLRELAFAEGSNPGRVRRLR